jgi:hypothetical protein
MIFEIAKWGFCAVWVAIALIMAGQAFGYLPDGE